MKNKLMPQTKLDKIELTEAWKRFRTIHPSRAAIVANPGYWNEDRLVRQGLKTKPITDDDISAYVSPLQVRLAV